MAIIWGQLQERYDQLNKELINPSLDPQLRQKLQKEHGQLSDLLNRHTEILECQKNLEQLRIQEQESSDPEMKQLFQEEILSISQQVVHLEQELEELLYPPDPLNDRSVFLEIRAGTGGQEAALFASDLLRMYSNYALKKNWRVSLVSESTTDLGGIRDAVLHIEGKNVYGHLKFESGVHRVQRVPRTETQGRIHTSTATVAVLPEAQEVDVQINPSDLRIDTYRAGGAGGQHVNKTDSAVRITHVPTGIVVACQDDRSQHKNKAKALKVLQSRILSVQIEQQEQEMAKQRKAMVGAGSRAEKARTYNYPQNRVTDHEVGMTLNKLDIIMTGELDELIQAHIQQDREQRKKQAAL